MIYLDHAASTPVRPEAAAEAMKIWQMPAGNPSGLHPAAQHQARQLREARRKVAACLGVDPIEILFTSGGTESNHAAVWGTFRRNQKVRAWAATTLEHPSLHLALERAAEESGLPFHAFPSDPGGRVDLSRLSDALPKEGLLFLSTMAVNNETGVIQPFENVSTSPHRERLIWHVDASQSAGKISLQLTAWGCDLATLSGHKIGAPAGIGILYRRKGLDLGRWLDGGGQEFGLRSGTENVALASAFATALESALQAREGFHEKCRGWHARLTREISELPGASLHILHNEHSAAIFNFSLAPWPSDILQMRLGQKGLAVSGGASCSSGAHRPSRVLTAMGLPPEKIRSALRLSFGWTTTDHDIEEAVIRLRQITAEMQ